MSLSQFFARHGNEILRATLEHIWLVGVTMLLAIGIGVSGLFLTGLIAGIAVYAMRTALTDDDTG